MKSKGFTLIELMIVVAVIAVLAGVAVPAYQEQIAKAKRADAASALATGAQALERYYTTNGTYLNTDGNLAAVFPTKAPDSGSANYTIAATGTPTANSFTLRATRTGSMANDRCGNLQLSSVGTRTLHDNKTGTTVADCWRR
ncbi:type IV pilin protein [Litorivivens sp.]|uniref:type IV pilin protein n=1 Tax=Litorivivens sp. TaxID=2020868 RepID=UPI0035641092